MLTDTDFDAVLDADPHDYDLRLVIADWLEDRGRLREAAYQRWFVARRVRLARPGKWSRCGDGTSVTANNWYCGEATGLRRVDDDVWVAIPTGKDHYRPTRRELEDVLLAACRAAGRLEG